MVTYFLHIASGSYFRIVASLPWSSLTRWSLELNPQAHANERNQSIENWHNNNTNHGGILFAQFLSASINKRMESNAYLFWFEENNLSVLVSFHKNPMLYHVDGQFILGGSFKFSAQAWILFSLTVFYFVKFHDSHFDFFPFCMIWNRTYEYLSLLLIQFGSKALRTEKKWIPWRGDHTRMEFDTRQEIIRRVWWGGRTPWNDCWFNSALHCKVKLQLVLCFSNLFSFDKSLFHAFIHQLLRTGITEPQKLPSIQFTGKQKLQILNPEQLIEYNEWDGTAHCWLRLQSM